MKDVRFYEECRHKYSRNKSTRSAGNVVAIIVSARHGNGNYDGVGAVYEHADSPVASTTVSPEFLRKKCRRVSETRAREIHPNLFTYLDAS